MVINKEIILLISLIGFNICEGQYGLEGLGARISESVQNSLSPLRNLGPNLERELAPLNNLGDTIRRQVNTNLEQQLAPLNNLGATISQQVYEGLKPVRILQSIVKVMQGTDGTTIATFSPNNKKFIIRDGIFYECDGSISDENGSCSGTLKKYSFNKREDYCYSSSKTLINNKWYCLSVGSGTSTAVINGQIYCSSQSGPTMVISVDEYKSLCGNVARSVSYKYFTNNNLQETGNGLQCAGTKPQICTYSTNINVNNINSNIITGYSSGVIIN